MPKLNNVIFSFLALGLVPFSASANLFYDPDKSSQMANLEAVESARLTSEYLCGNSALYISANAASSEINGRYASVTGKIVTGDKSHDISASLNDAVSGDDVLMSGLNVRCNKARGAFKIVFSPGQVFTGKPDERLVVTSIEIYTDGTVIGSRSRRSQKPKH